MLIKNKFSLFWRGGIVAGICVWQFTVTEAAHHAGEVNGGGEDEVPAAADDQGGSTLSDLVAKYIDPVSDPNPSFSRLGQFNQATVAVDSIPCSKVGKDVLLRNGTAVDAAIAVLFCNGVAQPQSMGVGGGFLMTIFLANGTSLALVARELAPEASTVDMFANQSSTVGARTAGVPGEIKGYWEAKQRLGNPEISWSSLIEPAIKMSEEGIEVSSDCARALKRTEELIKNDPGMRSVYYIEEEKRVLVLGDHYVRPVLAKTLRRISEFGADDFYKGDTAEALVDDIERAGGILTKTDLENYSVSWENPVKAEIPNSGGLKVISSPPPGSGAVVAAILGIVGQYDPQPADKRRPISWHRFIEACKFAYAKRTLLGDWNYSPVKEEVEETVRYLTSSIWHSTIREKISEQTTNHDPKFYGAKFYNNEDHGTAHTSILSPAGDAVSVTSTVNHHFGGKFLSPKTGIILNNQMDDFSFPGLTNYFGVPPSINNFVHQGKRPLSSMSPSIVYDSDNRVVAVVGSSGGTKIITAVAQVLYNLLYLGQDVKQAVDSRRFHNQLYPDEVKYEIGTTKWMVGGLQKLGHNMVRFPLGGSTIQAIMVDRETGAITANADFRKNGTVDGF